MEPIEPMLAFLTEPSHNASQPILAVRQNGDRCLRRSAGKSQHGLYLLFSAFVQIAYDGKSSASAFRSLDAAGKDLKVAPTAVFFSLKFYEGAVDADRQMFRPIRIDRCRTVLNE
jgi:hypothetical protein